MVKERFYIFTALHGVVPQENVNFLQTSKGCEVVNIPSVAFAPHSKVRSATSQR